MGDEHVGLAEGALVQQQFKALAGSQPTALVLRLNAFRASAQSSLFSHLSKQIDLGILAHEFTSPKKLLVFGR
jgi:hypothetical protein